MARSCLTCPSAEALAALQAPPVNDLSQGPLQRPQAMRARGGAVRLPHALAHRLGLQEPGRAGPLALGEAAQLAQRALVRGAFEPRHAAQAALPDARADGPCARARPWPRPAAPGRLRMLRGSPAATPPGSAAGRSQGSRRVRDGPTFCALRRTRSCRARAQDGPQQRRRPAFTRASRQLASRAGDPLEAGRACSARTGLDDHDADAEGVQLAPQRLRQQVQRGLARAVGALAPRLHVSIPAGRLCWRRPWSAWRAPCMLVTCSAPHARPGACARGCLEMLRGFRCPHADRRQWPKRRLEAQLLSRLAHCKVPLQP